MRRCNDMSTLGRKPNLKDVAAVAGVSLGSVSRTLNGVANVGPQVRAQVMQAVAALDYRLNHAARSLRSRNSRTVGCMLTDVTNPLYARLFRVFEERFRDAGYMVMLANGLNRLDRELDILDMFHSRGMDGVVLAPGFERNAKILAAIDSLGIPAVILDRDTTARQDHVLFDHAPGVKAAVRHLLSLGHRRVALVVGAAASRPMRRRVEGFRAGFATHGIQPDPRWIVRLAAATAPADAAVSQLLALAAPPTAFISLGTSALADVLNTLNGAGLRVPHDVSVVSMGEPDFARIYRPAISTVVLDSDEAASQTCHMLLQRMCGETDQPPRRVLLPTQFVDRASCAAPPASNE